MESERIYAIEARSFGVVCYRGFAPLSLLSRISQADEYDQEKNPQGTQRNLKVKHAKEAYIYAKENSNSGNAIWPEIILNIRDKSTVNIKQMSPAKGAHGELKHVKVQLNWEKINQLKKAGPPNVGISRVDGNHRLHFAGGEIKKTFPALDDVMAPFCITFGLGVPLERDIFKTINETQAKLDTGHLLRADIQALPGIELWTQRPELYLANRLHEDTASPFYGRLHTAGSAPRGHSYLLKLKHLEYALQHLTKLNPSLKDNQKNPEIPFRVVLHFFNAVKSTWSEEFTANNEFMMLSNTGIQALCMFAGSVIQRAQASGATITRDYFAEKLQRVRVNDPIFWRRKGKAMEGQTGRPGAVRVSGLMMDSAYPAESELKVA